MSDDRRRGLLTDTERAVLLGDKEVSDNYYYTIVSRVRTKIEELDEDLEALEEHGALLKELQEIVCEDN
jgi:hypothetical protein